MATKASKMGVFGGMHTAGIFSNMTVDGPNIGTLVVIMDRAKNLPNRRSMGKQDPYCAARLGKEAKKTTTDKRGGQTPRWDQELRFPVHDSPDYHNLKVSVFNDDKKTELIGETWVSLEDVLLPGGGQSDGWHGLNCKGKYAGEVRIELTYYDTRPKEKAAVEKRKETARPESGSPAVGGPRESSPVKRRPLPSDPTRASPSPSGTPDHRGLSGPQPGPRGYPTASQQQQRPNEHTPTHQWTHHPEDQSQRRPLRDASPLNGAPVSGHHTPQHQQRSPHPEQDAYRTSLIPSLPNASTPQYNQEGFDMSYAAPKPYEPLAEQPEDYSHRATSQNDFRSSHGHSQPPIDLPHSYSAPAVPTQHTDPYHSGHLPQHSQSYSQVQNAYEEDPYHVEPLRTNRSHERGYEQALPQDPYQDPNQYGHSEDPYDPYTSHGRRSSAMQPTVEDEDDIPPPPPVHRSSAPHVAQHHQQGPPGYHGDAPAPLNFNRYKEEPSSTGYDSPPQQYGASDYSAHSTTDRRYTHPRPISRPVSRDTMAPSMLPASLVAGIDPSRQENRTSIRAESRDSGAYQTPPSYETPPRLRQHSEPDYRTLPQYETTSRSNQLVQHQSYTSVESQGYYSHAPPEQPRHTSPVHDPTPIVKPRAMSPGNTYIPADNRASRTAVRSMPTRKSVSPRPPSAIDSGERRLSGVPFGPDDFDALNPVVAKKSAERDSNNDRRTSGVEVNEKGQVVTFSGRVIDASDHLPLDSWAPEPEPKGRQKERSARERPVLSGARDLEAAKERERQYRKERLDRDRIREAVNSTLVDNASPSSALVSRHHYGSSNGSPMTSGSAILPDHDSTPPGSGGRNRLQKRNQRPVSTYTPPANPSPSHIPSPNNNVLRERENLGGYGSSPGYGAGSRHSIAAPPIPAKIPLEAGRGPASEDMMALSMELQTIDIGPRSRDRYRGTTKQRYGGY